MKLDREIIRTTRIKLDLSEDEARQLAKIFGRVRYGGGLTDNEFGWIGFAQDRIIKWLGLLSKPAQYKTSVHHDDRNEPTLFIERTETEER